jgi:uncharacterized membrane protein
MDLKNVVITVVDIIAWLGIIFATVFGYVATRGNYEYVGALGGFAVGCLGSGIWFAISAIHQNVQTIRDIAVKRQGL